MAEHKTCKHFDVCDYRNDVGRCPDRCVQYKHKDAVIVIRCKDCKYFELNPFDGCEVCTHISGYVRPDFGCVDGERKDND